MVMPWRAAYRRRSSRVCRWMAGGGAAGGSLPGRRPASTLAVRLVAWLMVGGVDAEQGAGDREGQVQVVAQDGGLRCRLGSVEGGAGAGGAAGAVAAAQVEALLAVAAAGRPRRRPGRSRSWRVRPVSSGLARAAGTGPAGRRLRGGAGGGGGRGGRGPGQGVVPLAVEGVAVNGGSRSSHLLVADLDARWGRRPRRGRR